MSYNYVEIRKFRGRYAQRNSFEVPDGALEIAQNVTVSSDFIISKRRGFYTYFSPGSGTLKELVTYENKLLAFYNNKVGYFNDTGVSPNLVGSETLLTGEAGVTYSVSGDRIPRLVEANENLYVTTDNGVQKLTSFNSAIASAGSPPGQDLSATVYPGSPAAWFASDKVVGYRALIYRKDANSNLILGAPGDVATITNPKIVASYTSAGAGPWTVTVTSVAHGLVTGYYVRVEGASGPSANGQFQITVVTADTFTYVVSSANPASGTLNYSSANAIIVALSIPESVQDVAQGFFLQIYRSGLYDIAGDVFSDYKLIVDRAITAAEISSNVAFFVDTIDDLLRGVELYTNENTGEGEFQANAQPPKALDVALFKNYTFYANCETRPVLNLQLVNPSALNAGDQFIIRIINGLSTIEETYVAREGVANELTYSNALSGGPTVTVTYNAHGLLTGDLIYVSNVSGGTYANQSATITSHTVNTFTFTLTGSGSPTALFFEGVTNGTNPIFRLDKTSTSFALQLQNTSLGIVKAISRRSGGLCYGRYLSDFSEIPGQFAILGIGFYSSIAARVNTTPAGAAFEPILATTYGSVISESTVERNKIYISKVGEPEAVPLVQFLSVGSENKAILRIAALRDSVIVMKEDGVYRLSGDDPNNFVVTILDSTVLVNWPDSVDVINNQVACLANVGVCLISETAVNIISRKIEEDIRPILGRASSLAHGVAYESERLYLLTTSAPNNPALSVTHIYNTLTDEWTTWDKLFLAGCVGPQDTLYLVDVQNMILRERKSQTRLDFSDQFYATTITSVSGSVVTFSVPIGVIPEVGDILVKGNVINRISTVPNLVGVNLWTATLANVTTLIVSDTPILYKRIRSQVVTVPFHAGQVGNAKHFAQTQLHFRSDQCSRLQIYFVGDYFLGGDAVDWREQSTRLGFGYFPFGFDYFGQPYGIDLPIGTGPGPICRIYVPIQQARSTYIQTSLIHTEAGEAINLQAQSWALRAYRERVTR